MEDSDDGVDEEPGAGVEEELEFEPEGNPLEQELSKMCQSIQDSLDGDPPVVLLVGGWEGGPNRTHLGHAGVERHRELLGVLDVGKQVESLKNFGLMR